MKVILTSREMDILRAMSSGLTNSEIALKFQISKYTVSEHRKKIILKFKAKNSCEMMYLACSKGFL